jgi:WD40 repeat protein
MPVLPRATLPAGCWILCLSPDGRFLATRHEGRVLVWDVAKAQPTAELPYAGWPDWDFAFSADGHWLAGSGGGQFKIWELPAGRETAAVSNLESTSAYPSFSPDGRWLAFCVEGHGQTQHLKVWDLAQRSERTAFPQWIGIMPAFLWSPDGKTLAYESEEIRSGSQPLGRLHVWDAESGREMTLLDNDPAPHRVLAFSPDGHMLAAGERQRFPWNGAHEVKLWDLYDGKAGCCCSLARGIWELRFTGDGSRLLAKTWSSSQKGVWQLALIDPRAEPPAGMMIIPSNFYDATFSADGRLMASAMHTPGASVSILELLPVAREQTAIQAGPEDEPHVRAFSRDGQFLAVLTVTRQSTPITDWLRRTCSMKVASESAQEGIDLCVYVTATGQAQGSVPVANAAQMPALFTPDGRTLVALAPGHRPSLWDVPLHKPWLRIVAWWGLLAGAFAGAGCWLRRRRSARGNSAVSVPRSEKAEA